MNWLLIDELSSENNTWAILSWTGRRTEFDLDHCWTDLIDTRTE